MLASVIQGQLLEVTVVGCNKLRNTEWISRQDPYVCLEYATTKHRTRTCTDGGKDPTFQEKFVFSLIEGLREISVVVWNSNTLTFDYFIGTGKILLQKVVSQGYDDSTWSLQDKKERHAGEVRVIMYYANAIKPAATSSDAPPPAYAGIPPSRPRAPLYPTVDNYYPPPPSPYHHQPPAATYHPIYPPSPYHHHHQPPAAYPPIYPPSPCHHHQPPAYPPHDPHYYPPGSYPPPPYPPPPYY